MCLPEVKIDYFACVVRGVVCNALHIFASNRTTSGFQRSSLIPDARGQAWQIREMHSFWTTSLQFVVRMKSLTLSQYSFQSMGREMTRASPGFCRVLLSPKAGP